MRICCLTYIAMLRLAFPLNHKAVTSIQSQFTAAGRVHCRVYDVSCLDDLAPELSTLVRLRHQLNWYHKGCQPSCNAPLSLFSTASLFY